MKKNKLLLIPVLAISVSMMSGCGFVKPYDKPSYVEIKPNQTAFVIPLEGKTSEQGKFESEKFLKEAQVATKRIQVPHKWLKTGRWRGSGKWVDTVRVLVVDRYPETREWTGKKTFVAESKDSIKFNQGISATAQILEEDTAVFLYQYSGKVLAEVMDKEIRNKIGSVLLEQYGAKSIDYIRENKSKIIENVRKIVEPYFKDRGITLSNVGYIEDLKYLNKDIQDSINKNFKAEQEQKAQTVLNKTEIEKATAEKKANGIRKEAIKEIKEMKQLELQEQLIKTWDGKYPESLVINGSNQGNNLMLNIPGLSSK